MKGWKASSGWGFPKGKINEEEEEYDCAIREVCLYVEDLLLCSAYHYQTLEETGFDVTPLLDRRDFIKNTLKEQQLTLYIVPDVPEDTVFETKTRKEISVSLTVEYGLADTDTFRPIRKLNGLNLANCRHGSGIVWSLRIASSTSSHLS